MRVEVMGVELGPEMSEYDALVVLDWLHAVGVDELRRALGVRTQKLRDEVMDDDEPLPPFAIPPNDAPPMEQKPRALWINPNGAVVPLQ